MVFKVRRVDRNVTIDKNIFNFEFAINFTIPRFIRVLKSVGEKMPGDLHHIDFKRNTIYFALPIKMGDYQIIAIHVSERGLNKNGVYTSNRKKEEHLVATRRGVKSFLKILRSRGFKVKNYTLTVVLICWSYTKRVVGGCYQVSELDSKKVAVYVFNRFKNWTKLLFKFLYQLFNRREKKLREKKIYGELEEFAERLGLYALRIAREFKPFVED